MGGVGREGTAGTKVLEVEGRMGADGVEVGGPETHGDAGDHGVGMG